MKKSSISTNILCVTFITLVIVFFTDCTSTKTNKETIKALQNTELQDNKFKRFTVTEDVKLGTFYDGDFEIDTKIMKAGQVYLTGIGMFEDSKEDDYIVFDDGYDCPQTCVPAKSLSVEEYAFGYIKTSILKDNIIYLHDEKGEEVQLMKLKTKKDIDFGFYADRKNAYALVTPKTLYIFGKSDDGTLSRGYLMYKKFRFNDEGTLTRVGDSSSFDGNCGGGYSFIYVPEKKAFFNEYTEMFYYIE